MKYAIWFIRFWYVAWMIPAGIEHFYHIYPQPGATTPHPLAAENPGLAGVWERPGLLAVFYVAASRPAQIPRDPSIRPGGTRRQARAAGGVRRFCSRTKAFSPNC
jgi:hypothetical protein